MTPLICDSPRDELQALHEKMVRRGLVQDTPLVLPARPGQKPQEDKPKGHEQKQDKPKKRNKRKRRNEP